jgi:hypothetical protein
MNTPVNTPIHELEAAIREYIEPGSNEIFAFIEEHSVGDDRRIDLGVRLYQLEAPAGAREGPRKDQVPSTPFGEAQRRAPGPAGAALGGSDGRCPGGRWLLDGGAAADRSVVKARGAVRAAGESRRGRLLVGALGSPMLGERRTSRNRVSARTRTSCFRAYRERTQSTRGGIARALLATAPFPTTKFWTSSG